MIVAHQHVGSYCIFPTCERQNFSFTYPQKFVQFLQQAGEISCALSSLNSDVIELWLDRPACSQPFEPSEYYFASELCGIQLKKSERYSLYSLRITIACAVLYIIGCVPEESRRVVLVKKKRRHFERNTSPKI